MAAGKRQREISRITGVDPKTIRKYQEQFMAAQANSPTPPTGTGPPAIGLRAASRIHGGPVAATTLRHGHLPGSGGPVWFRPQLRQRQAVRADIAPPYEPAQFDRLDFLPGEKAQVDYGDGALTRVPGTNRYRKPRLFVMTPRYSLRSSGRVVWKSGKQVWVGLHEQAWRHFGGVTQYVVLDNLKEGVVKPDLYEPELNPVYAAMLAHYVVVADPACVRDPN